MWALVNRTPYGAERNWIRDLKGTHHWLVAVKATFGIAPDGRLKLADEQPPPLLAPRYRGEPGKSSLLLDSDLLEAKPGTDVLVEANAHAPKGKAVTTLQVGLKVAALEKTLLVHGVRVYYRGALGLTTSAPRPFTTRPIQYEWAFGGADTSHADSDRHRIDARNPVGKGFAVSPKSLDNQNAHAIEYANRDAAKAGPAGFGPIDRSWSPRRELAGTYGERWERTKKPLLPDDYDDRFALGAPADQRPPNPLRGGETVVLFNMTPEGTLAFDLPKVLLTFSTRFGRRSEEHRGRLAAVHVFAEEKRMSVLWQATLPVRPADVEYLDNTTIAEKEYLR